MSKNDNRTRRLIRSLIAINDNKSKNAKKVKRELVKLAERKSATNIVKLFDAVSRDAFDDATDLSMQR